MISRRAKSMSCTRRRRHSIKRRPAPYSKPAISQVTPLISASNAATSSRVSTVGNRSRGMFFSPQCVANDRLNTLRCEDIQVVIAIQRDMPCRFD
jgi:hypothetical protein